MSSMCAISVFPCSQTSYSVRLNIGFPVVWTDGRGAGGRCTVTWLPNFLGLLDLLTHSAPQARFVRQSSAVNLIFSKLFFNIIVFNLAFLWFLKFLSEIYENLKRLARYYSRSSLKRPSKMHRLSGRLQELSDRFQESNHRAPLFRISDIRDFKIQRRDGHENVA